MTERVDAVALRRIVLVDLLEEVAAAVCRPSPSPTSEAPYGTGDAATTVISVLEDHTA
jgi:hypothetical protein